MTSDAGANAATVRAMWRAHGDGRVDAMLALLHPEVAWRPLSRPGRAVYVGHDGIRQMLDDLRKANGEYRVELDDVAETAEDRVTATGRIVLLEGPSLGAEAPVEFRIVLRGGLVYEVDTFARPR